MLLALRPSWLSSLLLVLSLLTLGSGCAFKEAPRVRVATATEKELEAVRDEQVVWYEFQEGDEVPVDLAFFGVMQGAVDGPIVIRAKQKFYFIMSKNFPMRVSFDGVSVAAPQANQTLIGVAPRDDGKGGKLGWMIFMGPSGDPEGDLKKLIEESGKGGKGGAPAGDGEPAPSDEKPKDSASGSLSTARR
jgi:hypothetical protein